MRVGNRAIYLLWRNGIYASDFVRDLKGVKVVNVYLQEEVNFKDLLKASNFVEKLPAFALAQVNRVTLGDLNIYQVLVYCFDDEVDVNEYID